MHDGKNECEKEDSEIEDIEDIEFQDIESFNTLQVKPEIKTLLGESNLVHWEKKFQEQRLEVEILLRMSEEALKDTLKELNMNKISECFKLLEKKEKKLKSLFYNFNKTRTSYEIIFN